MSEGRGWGRAIKKPAREVRAGDRFSAFLASVGAHHPVPAREGMVVVPVVIIVDAKRPVAEAAIAVVFRVARR